MVSLLIGTPFDCCEGAFVGLSVRRLLTRPG